MATETKTAQTLNADALELQKFGDVAHKWWDKNSEFKPLHEINPLRLDYIDRIASLSGKNVLDVGCGGGILSDRHRVLRVAHRFLVGRVGKPGRERINVDEEEEGA